jgi:hypothetical protein
MIDTLSLVDSNKDADRIFKKRDAEGKLIINNVLLNGHAAMLEYILTNWASSHANLSLTLEGHTTVLH